jgi:hypothetical protein
VAGYAIEQRFQWQNSFTPAVNRDSVKSLDANDHRDHQ